MGCSSSKQSVFDSKSINSLVRLETKDSAVEILESIHSGKTTSVKVVKAYLERIDQVNPKINACVEIMREDALA